MRFRLRHLLMVPTVAVGLLGTTSAETPAFHATSAQVRTPAYLVAGGHTFERTPWALPVADYRLTGRFGDADSLWSSRHTGLDFATAQGSTIRAVAGGIVTLVEYDGSYGYKTVVTLEDGTDIWYCHQDEQLVTPGERVRAGEPIGTVGSTGNVTGPHLHLEVRPGGGDPVDPWRALAAHGRRA
ncbi:MAG: M23 family metallopeptidase [Nocardioides sp.]